MKQCKITVDRKDNESWIKTRIVCDCGKINKDKRAVVKSEIYLSCKDCGRNYCIVVPSTVN